MNDTKNLLKDFDNVANIRKKEMRYNIVCYEIIDIIFDKVIEIMNKDKSIGGFSRNMVVKSAKNMKGPIKKYVLKMDSSDASDIIKKIDNMIKDL